MYPSHTRSELSDSINGEFHESQRSLGFNLGVAGHTDREQATGNLLDGKNGQATKVGGANLGEETLHQESNAVEVGDDNQRVRRSVVVLQITNGHPEEPGAKRLKALVLLSNGQGGADLARTLEETNEMLNLGGFLVVVAKMDLNLLHLLQGSLVCIQIILARLGGAVLWVRRRRSCRKGAALSDEISEERLILPSIHGVNDS